MAVSTTRTCKACGKPFIRFNTIQNLCRDCTIAKRKPAPQRKRIARSMKPIRQRGKVANQDQIFREKVVRPYLDKNFGIACANCGIMPPLLDDGSYSRHAIDHVRGKGPHPEDRFVVTNFQYLCMPCHEEKTGTVRWSPKAA